MKATIENALKQGAVIIDVRTAEEFSSGHNEKSVNIPLQEFEKAIKKFKLEDEIIVCCAAGGRSAMAAEMLKQKGFTSVINAGSWKNI